MHKEERNGVFGLLFRDSHGVLIEGEPTEGLGLTWVSLATCCVFGWVHSGILEV